MLRITRRDTKSPFRGTSPLQANCPWGGVTLSNNMTKTLTLNKIAAGLVAVAMIAGLSFAFAAQRAHAVTLSELVELFIALEIIPEDKAEQARAVLEEEGEEETTGGSMMGCSYNFTRDLKVGASGADVMDLQKFLNMDPTTQVAATGPGSKGAETSTFGPLTASAVTKFQEKYMADILTPLGLTKGTGFFGASTRAKANAICASAPEAPEMPDDEEGEEGEEGSEDDDEELDGGEASLEDFDALSTPSDEELAEGDSEVAVFGFEFDVEDGDAEVNRIDVNFDAQSNSEFGGVAEDEPWNTIEAVQLWSGDEMIAEEDADSEDDWSDKGSDVYQLRFSGLEEVIDEGETAEFTVSVTIQNVDDSDLDQTWKVWVPANGVRARDGAGIDQYTGSDSEFETFDVEQAGSDTELKLTTSSSNPKASTVKVDTENTTDDVTVLVFEVEAEDGEITLNDLLFYATTSTSVISGVVSDATLELDGNVVGDLAWDDDCNGTANGTGASSFSCMLFDLEEEDDELTLEKDEKITGKLMIDLKKTQDNYPNGTTVEFDVREADRNAWEVEDVNGDSLASGDRTGTANGERHTLQSEGLFAEIISIEEVKTAGDNNANDSGDFKIKFDVSAFDDTFYISATTSAATTFTYRVEDGSGSTVSTTTSAAVSSTATKEGDSYRIDDGDTEEFTLTVTLNPDLTNYYRIELDSFLYGTSATNPGSASHTAAPDEDFESDVLYLNK